MNNNFIWFIVILILANISLIICFIYQYVKSIDESQDVMDESEKLSEPIKCDICRKKIAHNVQLSSNLTYSPSNFKTEKGYYSKPRNVNEICAYCYDRIAEAQQKEINKIIKHD